MSTLIPSTASISLNFHLLAPCNMRCRACFSHLAPYARDIPTLAESEIVINNLARLTTGYSRRKLTFSGGEPTLLNYLPQLISVAKQHGFTTCVVTNGERLSEDLIAEVSHTLDWLALSVDSVISRTNIALGRTVSGRPITSNKYIDIALAAKEHNIFLKINTVVSKLNCAENFSDFLLKTSPHRWKIMQSLILKGENASFVELAASQDDFNHFVNNHWQFGPIIESSESMIDSYAMVSPRGRVYNNTGGRISYGRLISDMTQCEFQLWYHSLRPKLLLRGGDYSWEREFNMAREEVPSALDGNSNIALKADSPNAAHLSCPLALR